MVTGNLPYLTRGPFALFYGGAAIIPQLSLESAGSHLSTAYVTFIVFHIIMITYKKLTMRKLPTQQRLKEIVVSNFLNVFRIGLILVAMILLTFGLLHHLNTIKKNSTATEENIQKSPEDHWKNLMMFAIIETMIQTFSFLTNPALR